MDTLSNLLMCCLIVQIIFESNKYKDDELSVRETTQLVSVQLTDSESEQQEQQLRNREMKQSLIGLTKSFVNQEQVEAVKVAMQWLTGSAGE